MAVRAPEMRLSRPSLTASPHHDRTAVNTRSGTSPRGIVARLLGQTRATPKMTLARQDQKWRSRAAPWNEIKAAVVITSAADPL